MRDIISELWFGNIVPQESGIFNNHEFEEFLPKMTQNLDEFEKTLTKKQLDLFEKFMDSRNEIDCLAEKAIFSYGFKLGGKFVFEIMK